MIERDLSNQIIWLLSMVLMLAGIAVMAYGLMLWDVVQMAFGGVCVFIAGRLLEDFMK